jgi:hypothetical protein
MSAAERRPSTVNSFLPEDYLQKKAERRAIAISLCLFLVVAFGIVGAFFVTYHRWMKVKDDQETVNRAFATEAKKIEQLKVLEVQRDELKEKADVTLALVERVPRSILLAELINRMPKQLTLTELTLSSKRVQEAPKIVKNSSIAGPQTLAQIKATQNNGGVVPGTVEVAKPMPPRFDFRLELVGLSSSDEDVADYYQSLTSCPLLEHVDMIYSSDTMVNEVSMRKFRIEASIRTMADARNIEPKHKPRLSDMPTAASKKSKTTNPLDPTLPREDEPTTPVSGAPEKQE